MSVFPPVPENLALGLSNLVLWLAPTTSPKITRDEGLGLKGFPSLEPASLREIATVSFNKEFNLEAQMAMNSYLEGHIWVNLRTPSPIEAPWDLTEDTVASPLQVKSSQASETGMQKRRGR